MSTNNPVVILGRDSRPPPCPDKTINVVLNMVRMQVSLNGCEAIVQAFSAFQDKMEATCAIMMTAFEQMMGAQGQKDAAMDNHTVTQMALPSFSPPLALPAPPAAPAPLALPAPPVVPAPPELPEPPNWDSWSSPQIFQSTGAERFIQELEAVRTKMSALNAAKDALDMTDVSFLPPEAVSDITDLQQRIQNLGDLLQKAELQKRQLNANVEPEAFDALNSSIEKLRHSIFEAVSTQEELNAAMKSANLSGVQTAYTKLNGIIDRTEGELRSNTREQEKFNKTAANGQASFGALAGKIAGIAKSYLGMRQITSFLTDAWSGANDQIRSAGRLQAAMSNNNNLTPEGLGITVGRAQELEGTTTISATTGMAGQAKLAEYVQDPSNVAAMTEAMYNLASGIHGANISQDQLMQTADLMGKAMAGDIDALVSSGLKLDGIFGEAEQNILKTGTEAERAALVIQMVDDQLGGLAEAAAQMPEGAVQRFANSWGAIQEKIGYGIMPIVMQLVQTIQGYMPLIETIILTAFSNIINIIQGVLEIAIATAGFIIENWSWIGPILWGVVAALSAYLVMTNAIALATRIAAVAQAVYSAVLGASPIMLIISLVIGLIAAIMSLWQNNDAFAAFFMRTWNNLFNFFDQAQIIFAQVVNAIVKAFLDMRVKSKQILEDLINGAIDGLNKLITAVNKIPGVQIGAISHVSFAADAAAKADAIKQLGDGVVAKMKLDAQLKANQREQKLADEMKKREENRLKKESERDKLFEMPTFDGQDKLGSLMFKAPGAEQANLGDINKVGEVGRINDTVDISSEDLKTMRELAEMKNIQNFVTLTPQLAFGDTHIRQDGRSIDEIVSSIAERMEQEISSSARGVFGV